MSSTSSMPASTLESPATGQPTYAAAPDVAHSPSTLIVCLPLMADDALHATLHAIGNAFPGEALTIATPQLPSGLAGAPSPWPSLHIVPSHPEGTADRTSAGWVLSAADYAAAATLAQAATGDALQGILLLGVDVDAPYERRADGSEPILGEPPRISPAVPDAGLLRRLADCVRRPNVDLVLPRYATGPADGLVNSALLYPLTRALFGADVRSPLPVEAALSPRMAARLGAITQRQVSLGQGAALVWPVAEAAISGFAVREVTTTQPAPQRPQDDFNALFSSVASSLFSDIEVKANFWQRARTLTPRPLTPPLSPLTELDTDTTAQIGEMIDSFHLAQANLQEIWSLVLPPQSRLALKKLATVPADDFSLEPALWARIVYDFALSFHLRTLNRGHLLGAMVPLYLAWVASHLHIVGEDATRAGIRNEATASAFETEKPYLVSRWRWPDRFNP